MDAAAAGEGHDKNGNAVVVDDKAASFEDVLLKVSQEQSFGAWEDAVSCHERFVQVGTELILTPDGRGAFGLSREGRWHLHGRREI